MEKSLKRGIRRAHYERLKIKRSRHWGYPQTSYRSQELEDMDDDIRAFVANTPTPCSCWGCGNPRRHFKAKTRKEAQSVLDYVEQCDDAGVRPRVKRDQVIEHWW